jgi:hypothetical protein
LFNTIAIWNLWNWLNIYWWRIILHWWLNIYWRRSSSSVYQPTNYCAANDGRYYPVIIVTTIIIISSSIAAVSQDCGGHG